MQAWRSIRKPRPGSSPGALKREVDANLTLEAQIDAAMARFTLDGSSRPAGEGSPGLLLTVASFRQALRIALVTTHTLPTAGGS
ncbi:hypothetical protein [Methylobacterium sp. 22177]|uniref:hypothetical protein n=1 Tax=Methylobacterium sp. 22177 TaxID=3453885 RepID=UPI003F87E612